MKRTARLTLVAALAATASTPALAGQYGRYIQRPPVIVSPDLNAPWVLRVKPGPHQPPVELQTYYRATVVDHPTQSGRIVGPPIVGASARSGRVIDPMFLPQIVDYRGGHGAGTIVIDTRHRFLYHVMGNGKAMRYGVGVGREGFQWQGSETVTRKAEWPDWRPPAEMIARERARGRHIPAHVSGGPGNPLGARALYLGSTLYRIHGSNEPWSIGQQVSSGCIRMRNEDVIELYNSVKVGTRVVVM